MATDWQLLLAGRQRGAAHRRVRDIARRLRTLPPTQVDHSLAAGGAGIALALAHIGQVLGDDRDTKAADAWLGRAVDAAAFEPAGCGVGLFGGLVGVGWVSAHLERLSGRPPDEKPDDLDQLVLILLERPRPATWELAGGLVGLGVYAIERGGPVGAQCLGLVLDRLQEVGGPAGEWTVDTMLAFGDPLPDRPARYVDLGMAHGVAGLVALAAAAGDPTLVRAAARFLLAYELPPLQTGRFPWAGGVAEPSRLAWCYGDAGVACALTAAAAVVDDAALWAAALRTAAAASRSALAFSGLADLGLCHGAAGVAHILYRLAAGAGDDNTWAAARRWAREVISGPLPETPGFLTGQAGIALALLAMITDAPPVWDRVLLLDGAGRDTRAHRTVSFRATGSAPGGAVNLGPGA